MKKFHSQAVQPRFLAPLVPLVVGAALGLAACSEQSNPPANSSQHAKAPETKPEAKAPEAQKPAAPTAPAAQAPAAEPSKAPAAAEHKTAASEQTPPVKAQAATADAKIDTQVAKPTNPTRGSQNATTTNNGANATTPTDAQQNPNPPKVDPNAAEGSALAQNAQAAPGGPAPRLESDANDHDFGTAIEGEKLTHTFKLKSAGQADLVITNAKPTCGCTIAKLELVKADGSAELYKFGDPCPPGTDLRLTAELDTKNAHGTKSSKINVYCNDPRTLLTLGLNARVDTYFVLTPNALQFGDLSVADSVEKSFQVSGKKPEPFKLTLDNKQLPDGMKIDVTPVEGTPDGKAVRWDCKVTLGPNCKEGNLGFPIQLRSDEKVTGAQPDKDGNTPTYGASVMVTARVQGLISWDPQYLSFGLVRPGQAVARALTVKSFDPNFSFSDPKVKLVGPSDQKPEFPYADSFSYVVKPSDDKKSLTVELTLNGLPETVDGSFQGRLMLETGHAVKPEIAVLFSGVCRPGVKATPTPVQPPNNPGDGQRGNH